MPQGLQNRDITRIPDRSEIGTPDKESMEGTPTASQTMDLEDIKRLPSYSLAYKSRKSTK